MDTLYHVIPRVHVFLSKTLLGYLQSATLNTSMPRAWLS